MAMQKIKTGDDVVVIAGRSKGKRGTVKKVFFDANGILSRVLVDGVNFVYKHVKPNPQRNVEGGIQKQEASIHVSNVKLFNTAAKKGDRVGIKTIDGKKRRYFKSNDEVVDIE